jgi:hypothetical protein
MNGLKAMFAEIQHEKVPDAVIVDSESEEAEQESNQ